MRTHPHDEVACLFQAHYLELVRLAFLLTSDRELAEDLVQEAFVRVWQRWRRIRRPESAAFYLRTTVVNLARTSLRRRLVEFRYRASEVAWPQGVSDSRIDLTRALAKLSSRKRACVVLRYYADLSEEETAHALGISVGTVKSQTSRALRQLERILPEPNVVTRLEEAPEGGER
jgi:RNA polymerase sigma-70 factor (sigma-E family)